MRFKNLGRHGVWLIGRRWSFSYWPPRTRHPFGIREGLYGHRGWWGAAVFERLPKGYVMHPDPLIFTPEDDQ